MELVETRKYINERYKKITEDCIAIEKVMFECKTKDDDEGYWLFNDDFKKKKSELEEIIKSINELDKYEVLEKYGTDKN